MNNLIYPRLPSGYAELTHIESTGTQYIDTGIYGSQNTKVELTCRQLDTDYNKPRVFGSRYASNNRAFCIGKASNNNFFAHFDTVFATIVSAVELDTQTHLHTLSKNGYYIDNVLVSNYSTPSDFTTPSTLKISAFDNDGVVDTSFLSSMHIISCYIWSNDTLSFNGVPALRLSDSVVGMYDLVSNTFFTNAGTGSFIAGEKVHYVKEIDYKPNINICNEDFELGVYNLQTGVPVESTTQLRLKEPIAVIPNQQLYCLCPANLWCLFFDRNGNIMPNQNQGHQQEQKASNVAGDIFTIPSNCTSIKIFIGAAYGTTYNYDICINISNLDINGHYYQYAKGIKRLTEVVSGKIIWQTEADKLRMELAEQAGIDYADTDVVDLGSLTWVVDSAEYHRFSASKPSNCKNGGYSTAANILCPIYNTGSWDGTPNRNTNKTILVYQGNITVCNTAYDNATAFKNANKGILLAYETT